ncbi:MAG: hypothetical protein HZA37_00675 [Parcubacteria group bacterium]|nr:hypothetical protein [Parcubacteria group bacterium]
MDIDALFSEQKERRERLVGVACPACSFGSPVSKKRWLEKIQMMADGYYYLLFRCEKCAAIYPIVGLKSAFPWKGARNVAAIKSEVERAERARKMIAVGQTLDFMERG